MPVIPKVQLYQVYEGYDIKYDPHREKNQYTALGPEGRIVDTNSYDAAFKAIHEYRTLRNNSRVLDLMKDTP
jgi:hypothetical protein